MSAEQYYETKKYRCLIEHAPRLSQSLFLTSCGIEYCTPNKSNGPVKRPGYHLHVILSGEGTFETRGRSRTLHGGQMFMEKPGELTTYYPNKDHPWSYCWVTFDGEDAAYYAAQAGFGEGINTGNSYVDAREFYKIADRMLSNPGLTLSANLWRTGLLHQFLSLAVESYARLHVQPGRKRGSAEHSRETYVDHALDFIHRNYSSIKVADIASYLGIDRSYFANLFKEKVGISPCDYLQGVRMEKSAQLLLSTQLPVQDIAEYVGYENPLTFSKAFRKAFGVSPKYYRQQPDESRVSADAFRQSLGTGREDTVL